MSAVGEKMSVLQLEIGMVRAVIDLLNASATGERMPAGVSGGLMLLDELSNRLVARSDDLERAMFDVERDRGGGRRTKKGARR